MHKCKLFFHITKHLEPASLLRWFLSTVLERVVMAHARLGMLAFGENDI
jgi:hypothetical protein